MFLNFYFKNIKTFYIYGRQRRTLPTGREETAWLGCRSPAPEGCQLRPSERRMAGSELSSELSSSNTTLLKHIHK